MLSTSGSMASAGINGRLKSRRINLLAVALVWYVTASPSSCTFLHRLWPQ